MDRAAFKQAMIDSGKYERIGEFVPPLAPDDHAARLASLGASLYQIPVVEKVMIDGVNRTKTGTQYVTVFDEDTPQENVEWEEHPDREFLKRPQDTTFVDAVRAWYETDGNHDPNMVKFEVVEANKDLEFAILRVFEVDAGVAVEKQKFIYKDGVTINVAALV